MELCSGTLFDYADSIQVEDSIQWYYLSETTNPNRQFYLTWVINK